MLRALVLSQISSEGAGVLAQSFPDAQLLSHLDLSGNGFSDEGVRVLCLALPRCKALSALHLTHNEIGVHGASSLALIIPRCSMLSTLVRCPRYLWILIHRISRTVRSILIAYVETYFRFCSGIL